MYKVFFNERKVFLTDNFKDNFKHHKGLFYKYYSSEELKLLLELFDKVNFIDSFYLWNPDMTELVDEFKSCFKFIEAAGGLVKNKNDEYLFINRLDKWDIPKGKAEKNETIEETAIREVEEECGISGVKIEDKLISTYHTYHHKGKWILKKTHWYNMVYSGDETLVPQTKENITQAKWLSLDSLEEVKANTYASIQDVIYAKGL